MGDSMRLALLILLSPLLMGSTNPQVSRNLASGAVGCPPSEIGISNETSSRGIHNFSAHCNGIEYFCTYKYPAPIVCNQRAGLTPEAIEEERAARALAMTAWKAEVLEQAHQLWKRPDEYVPGMTVTITLKVDDSGRLVDMTWVSSTGTRKVVNSVKRAFAKAHPYPIPPDIAEAFSGVVFEFIPQE